MSLALTFLLFFSFDCGRSADLNVGTTLFTKADTFKECWSSDNIALLTSRMILEDLLPSTSILAIDSDEFVGDLVDYFRFILEIIRRETGGKAKHITLLAFADLLGGYLHHSVLPIAKYAFYSGLIDFGAIDTLLGLLEELKLFLRTNGEGWAGPPPQNSENFEIRRISLQPCNDNLDHCSNVMVMENKGSKRRGDFYIPLPFFDSVSRPSSVALPLRHCPLRNLESGNSSYVIMKFFVSAYKCLESRNVPNANMANFFLTFCSWIEHQVVPRLNDDRFYAAFGGVLRVRNTLRKLGMEQQNFKRPVFGQMFHDTPSQTTTESPEKNKEVGETSTRTGMILSAILITILVWFLLGMSFICYRIRAAKQRNFNPERGESTSGATSLKSSKYFFPDQPKSTDYKGTSSNETDATSSSDRNNRRPDRSDSVYVNKNRYREKPSAPRKGCECDDDPAIIDTNHTEKRLPSIQELSEKSFGETTKKRGSIYDSRHFNETLPVANKTHRSNLKHSASYGDHDESGGTTSGKPSNESDFRQGGFEEDYEESTTSEPTDLQQD